MTKAEIIAALARGARVFVKTTDYEVVIKAGVLMVAGAKPKTIHRLFAVNDKPLVDLRYVFTNDDYYLLEGSGRELYRTLDNANLAAVNGATVRPVKVRVMYSPTVD